MMEGKAAGDLATDLHDWLINQMRFRPHGRYVNAKPPTVSDLNRICRGPSVDVWKWVIGHVHHAEYVRKVKQNLAIHARQKASQQYTVRFGSTEQYSQEKAELQEKKRQLLDELKHTLSATNHLEKDIKQLEQEIQDQDISSTKTSAVIADTRRRSALVKCHTAKCQHESAVYDEYAKRVKVQIGHLTQGSTGGAVDGLGHQGDRNDLQSPATERCMTDVRDTCEKIQLFLDQLLKGEFGSSSAPVDQQREKVWSKLSQVLRDHPPSLVLMYLTNNALDSVIQLAEKTKRLDIKQDVENLRFRYENSGELVDVSSPPTTLQTVHQCLQDAQVRDVRTFFETQKAKNNAWKANKQLSQTVEEVHHYLRNNMKANPGALSLARKLFDAEVEVMILKTAVRTLMQEAENLKEKNCQLTQEKKDLYVKYQKIQGFTKLADMKQNMIRVLIKQNVSAECRLRGQQLEIVKYIQDTLSGRETELKLTSADMKDCISREMDTFFQLQLPYLVYTTLDSTQKAAIIDLSINKMVGGPKSSSHTESMTRVLASLEFPLYKAPECLFEQVLKLKNETEEMMVAMEIHNSMAQGPEGRDAEKKSAVDYVRGLCEEVKRHDKRHTDRLLPVLQTSMSKLTQSLSECLQVKDFVQAWWDQPAKDATPWVKVNDMTFQQWMGNWTLCVTRLRQQMDKVAH